MAAEMERDLIRERTLDGLRATQAQGRRGSRPWSTRTCWRSPGTAAAGGESVTTIARHLGIGRSTLYRALWRWSTPEPPRRTDSSRHIPKQNFRSSSSVTRAGIPRHVTELRCPPSSGLRIQ